MRDDNSAMGMGNGRAPDDGAARPMRAIAATLATPGQPRAHLDGLRLAQALDLGAQAAAFVVQRGDARVLDTDADLQRRSARPGASATRRRPPRLGRLAHGARGAPRAWAAQAAACTASGTLAGDPHSRRYHRWAAPVGARVRDGGATGSPPVRLLRLGHRAPPQRPESDWPGHQREAQRWRRMNSLGSAAMARASSASLRGFLGDQAAWPCSLRSCVRCRHTACPHPGRRRAGRRSARRGRRSDAPAPRPPAAAAPASRRALRCGRRIMAATSTRPPVA